MPRKRTARGPVLKRPKSTPGRILIALDEMTGRKLRERAEREETTVSEQVRLALAAWLA